MSELRTGSLFAGYGGLDIGVNAFFGSTTAWFVEFDAAPSKILAHHWPDVPNYGDVTAVDWDQVEPVDILIGGFPCQDVSSAGKRAGIREGTRSGLWSHFATAIDHLRPRYVVIENVRGLLSATAHRPMESDSDDLGQPTDRPALRALGAVLGDLADLGYDAQWTTVQAADVGACHRRARVFILATPGDAESKPRREFDGERASAHRIADVGDLLPTPAATNRNEHESPAEFTERVEKFKDLCGNGNGAGMPLGVAVQDLLPTPRSSDPANATSHSSAGYRPQLGETVRGLLPTPAAADGTNGGEAPESRAARVAASGTHHGAPRLATQIQMLPTPEAGRTSSGQHPNKRIAGGHQVGIVDVIHDTPGWVKYGPALSRHAAACGREIPDPTIPNTNGRPTLNPVFAEWMMMLPAGHLTDPAIGISRSTQIKAAGNGVVPPQATHALELLFPISQIGHERPREG